MKRRSFVTGAGAALLVPRLLEAQPEVRSYRVGVVSAGSPRSAPHWIGFEQRLRELGYVPGRNVVVDFRNADGHPDRMPGLMRDLVGAKVDVLVAPGPEAALRAALAATRTIPIVVVAVDYDPVARGHVESLARPGTNATGVFLRQVELTNKRVGLVKDLRPSARRVTVFSDVFGRDQLAEVDTVARSIGLEVHHVEFREPPYDLTGPAQEAANRRAEAVLCLASPVFFRQSADVARALLSHRLAGISPFRELTEAGVLISYGASLPGMFRRAAEYVDRLLRGANPADLPLEQPTQFELVVNVTTARIVGVTLSAALRLRADSVVE